MPRQAVVLIHGIGEQMPMDTLRAFVSGLGYEVRSEPDTISGHHDLRRLIAPARNRESDPIDFYELYWADSFSIGSWFATVRWALRLIIRHPFPKWTKGLRMVVGAAQVLAVAALASLGWLAYEVVGHGRFRSAAAWALLGAVVSGAIVTSRFVRGPIASAARYLSPGPRDLAQRNQIRAKGLELLARLHEDGRYGRIVVVGHSLGSVIGYDLLRLSWHKFRYPTSDDGGQAAAKSLDLAAHSLTQTSQRRVVDDWQDAQRKLHLENKANGVRWLVTDFVTMGSPLAHGSLLLRSKTVDLEQRQREREYPTCPPRQDERARSMFFGTVLETSGGSRSVRTGHSGAVFSSTTWTNMYFPTSRMFLGDLVGGPVAPVFGPGVVDVAVRVQDGTRAVWARCFPWVHSRYWVPSSSPRSSTSRERRRARARTGTIEAVAALRAALALANLRRAPRS